MPTFLKCVAHKNLYPCSMCEARTELRRYNAMDPIERKREQARRTIERAEAQLARLDALPAEPILDGDPCPVIYFAKSFGGSAYYDYAAIKASDGLWYTTGPRTPKGFTWDALIEWITDGGTTPVTISLGTEWKQWVG